MLDLYNEFPDLQPIRKHGRGDVSRLKIGRPALRTVFPDDYVDVSLNSSPFPPRGEQPRRPPRLRCLTVIRPDRDLSPCFSATLGLLAGHINTWSCRNKEDDIVEFTRGELGHSLHH